MASPTGQKLIPIQHFVYLSLLLHSATCIACSYVYVLVHVNEPVGM